MIPSEGLYVVGRYDDDGDQGLDGGQRDIDDGVSDVEDMDTITVSETLFQSPGVLVQHRAHETFLHIKCFSGISRLR